MCNVCQISVWKPNLNESNPKMTYVVGSNIVPTNYQIQNKLKQLAKYQSGYAGSEKLKTKQKIKLSTGKF